MPVYGYKAKNGKTSCSYCKKGFELLQKVSDGPIKKCPKCGAAVERVISSFSLGLSKSALNGKAKEKGFHKLRRVDKGKYEKLY